MTPRVHLLVVLPTLDAAGGAEVHVERLLPELQGYGYDITVASFGQVRSPHIDVPSAVRVKALSDQPEGGSLRHALRAIRPLRRLIESEHPDLVLALLEPAALATFAAIRGARFRPPVIVSVQNALSRNYSDAHPVSRFLVLRLCRKWFRRAAGIIATSQGVADELSTMLPGAPRAQVIHNAVYRRQPTVALAKREDVAPLMVACGRLTEQKGFPFLLAAMPLMKNRDVVLWIIGEGRDRQKLETLIATMNLNDRVKLLGFQPQPEQFMAAADVFVLSSLWEGFGNVLVEAMSCGTPVVTTDCPYGPAEIVRHEVDGLVVPIDDRSAFATAVDRILANKTERERMGVSAAARARQFSARASAVAHDAMFRRIVSVEEPSP